MIKEKEYKEFEKLRWVCKNPIPAVGSKVNVKINGIGESTVLRYFVEYGFIGLLVQPIDPPAWYRKQNESKTDSALYDWEPCHVFPAECEELQARKADGSVDKEFYEAIHAM